MQQSITKFHKWLQLLYCDKNQTMISLRGITEMLIIKKHDLGNKLHGGTLSNWQKEITGMAHTIK